MKILFSAFKPLHLKNFDATVRLLARRHEVELAVHKQGDEAPLHRSLAAEVANVVASRAPRPAGEPWHVTAQQLRACRDLLHFTDPRFNTRYRERAQRWAPPRFARLAAHPLARGSAARGVLGAGLGAVDALLPASPVLLAWLTERSPDVVVLTPYIGLHQPQPDVARAALALGIPTVAAVFSWDNLTSKSLMRPKPDLVTVWNAIQRQEAISLHGIASGRVAVTGAQCFDAGFDFEPSPREEFCRRAGLDPERPYVLYTCFTPFGGERSEIGFVRRWLEALRSTPALHDVGVLIRPHFKRGWLWRDVDLGELGPVTVWPPEGAIPADEASRRDFHDSLHHSAAVVGLNTSAMIDAAIAGRAVHTVLVDEFLDSQEGTLHFRYLREVGGGALRAAEDLPQHVAQLAESVARSGAPDEHALRFVARFVRPAGLDRPAAPILAAAIEAAGRSEVRPRRFRLARDRLVRSASARAVTHLTGGPRLPPRRRGSRRPGAPGGQLAEVEGARAALERLAAGQGTVIAGPWLGDAGLELLYWVPFLAAAVEAHPQLRQRLVAVSRGGAQPWYRGLGVRYADVFELLTPDELNARLEQSRAIGRGHRRQATVTPLDDELIEAVAARLDIDAYDTLHPSVMHPAWRALLRHRALSSAQARLLFSHRRLTAPDPPADVALPDEFVVACFHGCDSFPPTPENVAWARAAVEALACDVHVVRLDPLAREPGEKPLELDAHVAWPGVHVETGGSPRDELAVRTAVVARARAVVGTYGGSAYLPSLLGIPSHAIFSQRRFRRAHLELAQRVFASDAFGQLSLHAADRVAPEALAADVLRRCGMVPA